MNAFTQGFISAAKEAGLNPAGLKRVVEKVAASGDLTEEELLAIRRSLATPQNIENYYGAPYQNFAAQLLAERDQNLHSIPELAAAGKALSGGATGAAMGGLTGYGAGHMLRSGNILGSSIPYSVKKSLPTALGTTGAVIGALVKALPGYTEKLEQGKAFRKMHAPHNIQKVLSNVQMDRALLNS
jgi:hypothetical protein